MPARVEYRLGSIFDEACDVLVIPSSAGGTVSPSMAEQLRKEGIPFPTAMSWGSVTLGASPSPRFGAVAYASTLRGQATMPETVKGIGQRLGSIATAQGARTISAPLLGAGAGDLAPDVAAAALERGFLSTAPDGAVLTVSIRRADVFWSLPSEQTEASTAAVRETLRRIRDRFTEESAPEPHTETGRPGTAAGVRAPVLPHTDTGHPGTPAGVRAPVLPPEGAEASGPAAATRTPSERTRVFISYSHEDAEWLERLQKHLAPLEREGALVWDDTRLKAGARWREEIRAALDETRVAILLVSADFLASDFIATDELPPLLQAAAEDGATILPVIISPCRFERMESLSRFQSVNDPRKPLVKLRRGNREEVLDAVARAVEDALRR